MCTHTHSSVGLPLHGHVSLVKTRTSAHYTGNLSKGIGIYFKKAGPGTRRNINNASGVVFAPKVKPIPLQFYIINGT